MTTIKHWDLDDIWCYGRVNIDPFTETYAIPFYMFYSFQWGELNFTVRNNKNEIVGYIIGQVQNENIFDIKGHVTAVTVCEDYRRLGIASLLMSFLEKSSDEFYKAYYVDLFVRPGNSMALNMYEKLGYKLYRRIPDYYDSYHEDGLDLRKSLSRDPNKSFMIPMHQT